MKKITAVFLASLALMIGIGLSQAAELKFWGRAGGDEIISIRDSSRPILRVSDTSNKTVRVFISNAGNMQLDGNLTVGGTITNDFNANTTLTTLRVSTTTMLGGSTTSSGAILGHTTGRLGTTLTVGTTSTFSGRVSALGVLSVGSVATFTGDVQGSAKATWATLAVGNGLTAASEVISGSGRFGTTLMVGTTSTYSGRVNALDVLSVGSVATFTGDVQGSAKATWATLEVSNDLTTNSLLANTTGRLGSTLVVGTTTTASGRVDVLSALVAASVATFQADVQGTAKATWATLAVSNDLTAGSGLLNTTGRVGTTLMVGTTSTFSGLVTANGGAAFSGTFRQVRSEATDTTSAVLTVAQIQGGVLSFGTASTGVDLTFPTAATATCAGLMIIVANNSAATNSITMPLGEGGLGASYDHAIIAANGRMLIYCDGTNFWAISERGTVTYN